MASSGPPRLSKVHKQRLIQRRGNQPQGEKQTQQDPPQVLGHQDPRHPGGGARDAAGPADPAESPAAARNSVIRIRCIISTASN
ncbi:hypothetical protein KL931_002972 [Ogataea haglerorum]|nr:hypothetical protein KL931_002972 [Ogataea haglerorum]